MFDLTVSVQEMAFLLAGLSILQRDQIFLADTAEKEGRNERARALRQAAARTLLLKIRLSALHPH